MKFKLFGYTISIEKGDIQNKEMPKDLKEALKIIQKYGVKIPPSPKKVESAKKASQIKADKTKQKVINAINLLKSQKEKITPYKVSKVAGVSYNTAKKYLKEGWSGVDQGLIKGWSGVDQGLIKGWSESWSGGW